MLAALLSSTKSRLNVPPEASKTASIRLMNSLMFSFSLYVGETTATLGHFCATADTSDYTPFTAFRNWSPT